MAPVDWPLRQYRGQLLEFSVNMAPVDWPLRQYRGQLLDEVESVPISVSPVNASSIAALNISTGPLALRTFQTAGPVRASTLYLSLARQDHRVKCRASRLKITVARSMTNFATFSCILFLKFRIA